MSNGTAAGGVYPAAVRPAKLLVRSYNADCVLPGGVPGGGVCPSAPASRGVYELRCLFNLAMLTVYCQVALLVAEFAPMHLDLAALVDLVAEGSAAAVDDDALERLAIDIPDMRIRLGIKCAFLPSSSKIIISCMHDVNGIVSSCPIT